MSERVCGGIGVGHWIVFYDGCIYVYVEVEAASLLYTSPVESFRPYSTREFLTSFL